MRTVLVTEVFPPRVGGSGRWLWELYRRVTGIDVVVAADQSEGWEAFDRGSGLRTARLPLYFSNWGLLNHRGAMAYARAAARLYPIISKARPDEIHCGKCLPEGLLARLLNIWFRIPYSCFAHGEEISLFRTSGELRRLTGWVLAGAARVFANSEHTKQLLVDEWSVPLGRVVVMYPGVDTSRFVPAPANESIRARLGWNGRKVVLTVGALQERKGQDTMIRALASVRQACPNVLYVIAGEGWQRTYLENLVSEYGVEELVQFRGVPSDDEIVALYQQCDLFALPNRRVGWDFEGFGIVLLEAQACGRAVVAGRSGGAPEAISPGRTGELVNGDSPDDLATTIAALLIDDEKRVSLGNAGREWVTARFDWSIAARRFEALFQQSCT